MGTCVVGQETSISALHLGWGYRLVALNDVSVQRAPRQNFV